MLNRAKIMFRYDDECVKEIREVDNIPDEQVRQGILEASKKAKEKERDVIVNCRLIERISDIKWL